MQSLVYYFFLISFGTHKGQLNYKLWAKSNEYKGRFSVAIVAHPYAFGYYCAPPNNSKYILYLENLFAPSDEAANKLLVSNFLAKNTFANYFPWFAF